MDVDLDPSTIADPTLRALVLEVLNQFTILATENQHLRADNQRLRDEIARLTGEQGHPQIKPPAPPRTPPLSSEAERRTSTPRRPRSKQAHLVVTREQLCRCDPAVLPPDAQFKGYEEVLVQDMRLHLEVICFRKAKFYSPHTGQTFLAPLPPGYHGQFGPEVRALVLSQTFGANVSQPALLRLLRYAGLDISAGPVAGFLTAELDLFHTESSAVLEAGLASCYYQHADDTATRINGQNGVCQVLASPCYTALRTGGGKDRLSVLRALTDGQEVDSRWYVFRNVELPKQFGPSA